MTKKDYKMNKAAEARLLENETDRLKAQAKSEEENMPEGTIKANAMLREYLEANPADEKADGVSDAMMPEADRYDDDVIGVDETPIPDEVLQSEDAGPHFATSVEVFVNAVVEGAMNACKATAFALLAVNEKGEAVCCQGGDPLALSAVVSMAAPRIRAKALQVEYEQLTGERLG